MTSRSRDMVSSEVYKFRLRLFKQRAQGRPGARCTRGLVCIDAQEMRTRAYRFSGGSPAFPAQWFYDLYVLSLVIGLSCHHRPREALASQELDASVEASGPHDFAVRLGTTRQPCRQRPPHPVPRFVTIASRPFWWDRMGAIIKVIWGDVKSISGKRKHQCSERSALSFPSPLLGEGGSHRQMRDG